MNQMNNVNASYIWQNTAWPRFTYDAGKLLKLIARAREQQGSYLSQMKHLGFELSQSAQEAILCAETTSTAQIEGETYHPASVRSSIARHLDLPWTDGQPLDQHADGLITAMINATQNYQSPLTAEALWSWHASLFPTGYAGLKRITVGGWRETGMDVLSGSIGRQKVHFSAPPAERVSDDMEDFLAWFNTDRYDHDGLIQAAIAHLWFLTVHPFEDGNGRIARILTDRVLAEDEELSTRFYTLSHQINAERKSYYDMVESTQKGGLDITAWIIWFLECFIASLETSAGLTAHVLRKAKFWQHHQQVVINDRQRKVLNRLLDTTEFRGGLSNKKYFAIF